MEDSDYDSEKDEDLSTVKNENISKIENENLINKRINKKNKFIFPATKNTVISTAENDLEKNIWDKETWNIVIDEARTMDIEDARPIYKRALEQFPTNAKFWKFYGEHELRCHNNKEVEEILSKCLYQCPDTNIWEFYIDYVRNLNLDENFNSYNYNEKKNRLNKVRDACEFAVKYIGFHINSNKIWTKYIEIMKKYLDIGFLNKSTINNDTREVYQKALCIPMNELDEIWREYKNFENEANGLTCDRLTKEQESKKNKAMEIYGKKKEFWQNILNDELATPPTGLEHEREQLIYWKKALNYDKTNPRNLPKEEHRFHMRILYMQCLCVMRYHSDIWYDFAMFEDSYNDIDSSKQIFERACLLLSDSLIIHFSYCDYLENHNLIEDAKTIYEKLLTKNHNIEHQTLIYIIYQKFLLRTNGLLSTRKLFYRAINDNKCDFRIYQSTANIELYYGYNSNIARKIYQIGYDKYKNNYKFLSNYLGFLECLGDSDNVKLLYNEIFNNINNNINNENNFINDDLKLKYLYHLLYSNDKNINNNKYFNNICNFNIINNNSFSNSLKFYTRFDNGVFLLFIFIVTCYFYY